MTSLMGGGSIMHITNQLVGQLVSKQSAGNPGEAAFADSNSASPSYEEHHLMHHHQSENSSDEKPLTLEMFKNSGLFSCLQPSEIANSDTASSESPEPSGQENEDHHTNMEGLTEAQQIALLASFGQQIEKSSSREGTPEIGEATIRDLMPVLAAANQVCNPTSSPSAWARNAGRKKSHPVWDFFKDLKDSNGAGGVICLHCTWSGDDRSPNNLRTHLKKFHTDDGIFARFSLKLAQTPTQPYVKRVRGGVVNGSGGTLSSNNSMMMLDQKPMIDSMAFALQQLQQGGNLADFNTSLNFLESLPKSSEVINISGGFIKEEIDEDMENHVEAASSSSSDEPIRNSDSPSDMRKSVSPVRNGNNALSQQDVSELSNNQLAAFVNLASTNPMMLAMLNAANSSSPPTNGEVQPSTSPPPPSGNPPSVKDYSIDKKDPSSFSLSDGPCAAVLMSMALDLDMTMSYHRRRVDIELCFESNRTAEKSGGRGKVICLTDLGKEIKIIERVNGAVVDTELWTKTDFNQFHWAIRGKCQKCFIKA